MLRLFADNLLPVFLIAAAGAVVAARFRLDPRPISSVAFQVFSPCLIYDLLLRNELPFAASAVLVILGMQLYGHGVKGPRSWPTWASDHDPIERGSFDSQLLLTPQRGILRLYITKDFRDPNPD